MNNQPKKNQGQQEFEYYYFKDTQGRIKRIRKPNYAPRPGYIRIKFLQKWYIKYIRSSYDSKLTWMPWLVGLATCYFIYTFTMMWSQNDLNRQIKAKLPFEFRNQHVTEVYRLLKESKNNQSNSSKTQSII